MAVNHRPSGFLPRHDMDGMFLQRRQQGLPSLGRRRIARHVGLENKHPRRFPQDLRDRLTKVAAHHLIGTGVHHRPRAAPRADQGQGRYHNDQEGGGSDDLSLRAARNG